MRKKLRLKMNETEFELSVVNGMANAFDLGAVARMIPREEIDYKLNGIKMKIFQEHGLAMVKYGVEQGLIQNAVMKPCEAKGYFQASEESNRALIVFRNVAGFSRFNISGIRAILSIFLVSSSSIDLYDEDIENFDREFKAYLDAKGLQ